MINLYNYIPGFLKRNSHLNWALFDQAFVSLANFITGVLLARYLGIEAFGAFSLLWLCIFFFHDVKMPLIISPMMAISPKQPVTEIDQYFGSLFIHQTIYAVFSFVILYIGSTLANVYFPEWNISGLALPASLACFAFLMQDSLRRYFFTVNKPYFAFRNDAIVFGSQILFILILIYFNWLSASNILWIIFISGVTAVGFGYRYINPPKFPSFSFFNGATSRHWNFAKWITASVVLAWISNNLFMFVPSAYLGSTAAGILRACAIITGATNILFLGLENTIPLHASKRFHENGLNSLLKYITRVTLMGGLFLLVLTAIIIAAPELWLGLFFGDQYTQYGYILSWYAFIQIFIFLQRMASILLRTLEHTSPILLVQTAVFISAIVIVFPLISNYGLTGAMMGLFVNAFIALFVYIITSVR